MPLGIAALGVGLLLVYSGYHGYSPLDVLRSTFGGPAPAPKGPSAAPPGGQFYAPGAPYAPAPSGPVA